MLKIKQEKLIQILSRLDEAYATMIDDQEQPFFRERAEMLYKEFLLRLALLNIPIERVQEKHVPIQPQTRRVTFLSLEEEALEQINDLYTMVLGGKTQLQPELDAKILKAKELGMEVVLKPGGYDFAHQFNSIFDLIPPYVHKSNIQKTVRSQEKSE